MNVLKWNWGNGLKCREWDVALVGSNLVRRYGGWGRGGGGGGGRYEWVAGEWVLWKDSDTAMRPGAVCVGWHLPYSSNPVFLQLASYHTSPFPSFHPSFPPKGSQNSPFMPSFFSLSHFVFLFVSAHLSVIFFFSILLFFCVFSVSHSLHQHPYH